MPSISSYTQTIHGGIERSDPSYAIVLSSQHAAAAVPGAGTGDAHAAAIAVEAKEREAACAVALGSIYLADPRGVAWKRASAEEAAAFPVVTGIPRARYIHDRETSQALIREALAALAAWRASPRAAVGEVHVDPAAGVTLYTKQGGCAVHLGRGDGGSLAVRLRRVDAVLAALAKSGEEPQVIHADQAAHPERITVRLRKPST